MKRIGWGAWMSLIVILAVTGCEDEVPDTFGNPSLESMFEIINITDSVGEKDYDFQMPEPEDTTYIYYYLERDTLFAEDGAVDEILVDTIYYEGKTARLYKVPTISLPSYKNRLYIEVKSNARWNAPVIPFPTNQDWIRNSKVSGIGDAVIEYDVGSRTYGFPPEYADMFVPVGRKPVTQYITTQDSSVMFRLTFEQEGMKEE